MGLCSTHFAEEETEAQREETSFRSPILNRLLFPWLLPQGGNLTSVRAGNGLSMITDHQPVAPDLPPLKRKTPSEQLAPRLSQVSGGSAWGQTEPDPETRAQLWVVLFSEIARHLKILRPIPHASTSPRAASCCTVVWRFPDLSPCCRERAFEISCNLSPPTLGQHLVMKGPVLCYVLSGEKQFLAIPLIYSFLMSRLVCLLILSK